MLIIEKTNGFLRVCWVNGGLLKNQKDFLKPSFVKQDLFEPKLVHQNTKIDSLASLKGLCVIIKYLIAHTYILQCNLTEVWIK